MAVRLAKLGPDHPDTLNSQNDLALAYQGACDLERAIPILERTLASRRTSLGSDHPDTLGTQSALSNALRVAGRLERALPMIEQTLAAQIARARPGPSRYNHQREYPREHQS